MSFSRRLVFSTFAATGLATHFTSDTRISGTAAALGSVGELTTIDNGATCWLSGLGTHNIYGNLNINGNLVISQTDWVASTPGGQTSDWSGSADASNGVLINAGVILLNDVSAGSAPTYNWNLQTIQNKGTLHWCGRGDTGGSTFHLSASADLVNNGLIVYEQVNGNWGTAMTFSNSHQVSSSVQASANVYNNGGFLIRKARVDITQQILGNGCWMIDDGAILYLQDGLSLNNNFGYKSSLAGQSVSFIGGVSGTLHMDTAVYSHNSVFGATVFGFGAGHSIEFYETIKAVSYDSVQGVLTVKFWSANHVEIKIGTGYDATKFVFKANLSFYASFNAVFYLGTIPSQSAPSQCSLTADTCKPVSGPSGYSTGLPAYSTLSTSVKPTTTPLAGYTGALTTSPLAGYTGAPTTVPAGGSVPSYGGSGNVPAYGGSGNVPSYGGSGNVPGYGGSGNVPSYGGSGNVPSYGGSGNVPSYGGSANAPGLPSLGLPSLSLPTFSLPSLPGYGLGGNTPALPTHTTAPLPGYGLPTYAPPSYGHTSVSLPAGYNAPSYAAPSVSTPTSVSITGYESKSAPAYNSPSLPAYGPASNLPTTAIPSGTPVSSKAPISSPATSKAAGPSMQPPVYTSPSVSVAGPSMPPVYNSPSASVVGPSVPSVYSPSKAATSGAPVSSAPTSSCVASTTTVTSISSSVVTVTAQASTVTLTASASTVTSTQSASTVTVTQPASTVTITSYTSVSATPTDYATTTTNAGPTDYSTTSSADSSPTDSYDSYN